MRWTRVSRGMRQISAWTVAGTMLGSAALAAAQQPSIPLDRFEPAPAGDRFYSVPSPYAGEHLVPHVMLLADYAHNPLVLVQQTPDGDETVGHVVEHQGLLHLSGSLSLYERVAFHLDIPIGLIQKGRVVPASRMGYQSPDGPEFGDVRAGMRVRLFGEPIDALQLGIGGYLWLPTGPADDDSYLSDGSVRGMPHVLLGGLIDRFVWSLATGPEFRSSVDFGSVAQGSMWRWGGAVGLLLGDDRQWQLGGESNLIVDLGDASDRNTNAEGLLSAKWQFVDFMQSGVGIGTGFTGGIGTPDFRALLSIAYSPEVEVEADRDGDGVADERDACPDAPGPSSSDPARRGCPDRDGDGIVDGQDACPNRVGVASDDPAANGCPADLDGDGIPDAIDVCPARAGVASDDPEQDGCPPESDSDGDGIPDARDACPDEPGIASDDPARHGCAPDRDGDGVRDPADGCPDESGPPNEDPARNGCPQDPDGDGILGAEDACPDTAGPASADPAKNGCPLVQVTQSEVVINEQVQFGLNEATILPASDPLLDEVARVLTEHPELKRIEVQGHTDATGARWLNTRLSKRRAEAVQAALVSRGIDAARLSARGYGPDQPIADNGTEEGRERNRRVEFKILERAE